MDFTFIIPLVIAFLTSLFGAIPNLFPDSVKEKSGKQLLAFGSIFALLASLVWSGLETWQKQQTIESLRTFTESGLRDIDEASGGTVDPQRNVAYIVDDDSNKVFVFQFVPTKKNYIKLEEFPLKISSSQNKLKTLKIEDLEGATYYHGKLYLVTGHSDKKTETGDCKGKPDKERQQFLEVSLEEEKKGLVLRKSNLRKWIESIPEVKEAIDRQVCDPNNPNDPQTKIEYMNIEGLAIDPKGQVYLGFRSPLLQNKDAIVLRADLEQILKDPKPKYELIPLTLENKGKHYGISAMELDLKNPSQILILANGTGRYDFFPPLLWSWSFTNPSPESPRNLSRPVVVMQPPENFAAKPEVLLVPKADSIIGIFADAEGYGGQRIYTRRELGLDNNSTPTPLTKNADETLKEIQAIRDNIDKEFEAAEEKFPADYRFTYERAKLNVDNAEVKTHDQAFHFLSVAAEKAINNDQSNLMLEQMKKDQNSTFKKLARGHKEWKQIKQALQQKNKEILKPLQSKMHDHQ